MGIISRGIKNAFRNTIRTVSITFILGLSIAMALVMLLCLKTVQSKIENVKSSIGNTVTVSPAGVRGFEGGGELLTEQNATDIAALDGVSAVTKIITDRLTTEGQTAMTRPGETSSASSVTSLTSAITAGSFGQRQQRQQSQSSSGATAEVPRNFAMPITVTGTNDLSSATALSATEISIKSGEKFDANTEENVAIIGTDLATKNNLSVGSTFTAYAKEIKVVAIIDGGNTFFNGGTIVMPIKTLQTLSDQTGQVNSLIVKASSVDKLESVQSAIKNKIGADKIDITSSQDSAETALAPLENIKNISLYSLIGSLVAGSIIIFLTMIMIVRERRREIGVLKAIGSSNVKIVSQFTVEALVLTLLSSVLGMIIGLLASNPVLKMLVNNSQSSSVTEPVENVGRGAGPMMARLGGGLADATTSLKDIHAVIGWELILYGLLAAVVIAIIGSAIPAFFISKVQPAEVMRAE